MPGCSVLTGRSHGHAATGPLGFFSGSAGYINQISNAQFSEVGQGEASQTRAILPRVLEFSSPYKCASGEEPNTHAVKNNKKQSLWQIQLATPYIRLCIRLRPEKPYIRVRVQRTYGFLPNSFLKRRFTTEASSSSTDSLFARASLGNTDKYCSALLITSDIMASWCPALIRPTLLT